MARLPGYLRALTSLAREGIVSVSSEELADRGRRQLGHAAQGPLAPGLLRRARRGLRRRAARLRDHLGPGPDPGLAGRHRRAWATWAVPSPPTAASRSGASGSSRCSTATRAWSASGCPASGCDRWATSPRSSPTRAWPSGSSPRRPREPRQACDDLVAAGVRSVLNFAPAVLAVPDGVDRAQGRPLDRAADPRLPRAEVAVHGGGAVMSLVVLGLSHHGAPLSLLESVAVDPEARTAPRRPPCCAPSTSARPSCSRRATALEVYAECAHLPRCARRHHLRPGRGTGGRPQPS